MEVYQKNFLEIIKSAVHDLPIHLSAPNDYEKILNLAREQNQSVIFCGQFIHAILFCSLLLRLLSFDFSLRIFLAQAGQYLDAP
ncbi:MAG TPA: hypothetical protein IAB53_07800, partial [Candidatus Scybalocola faecipullorum]|nr:hypothetical protein [Candidatus Scybalocola faecipullorum]